MARTPPISPEEARQDLIEAAQRFVAMRPDASVAVVVGRIDIIRPAAAPPGAPPQGVSRYDAAILAALTDAPMSSRRLARRAALTFNSYLRERLSRLVEAGRVHRSRRGYSRPPAR